MNKLKIWMRSRVAQLGVMLAAYLPLLARADWSDTVNTELRNVRIGIYAITGTIAIGTLVYKGAQLLIARSQGDHSVTVKDYLEQCAIIVLVGGAVVLAVYLWGVFGSGAVA